MRISALWFLFIAFSCAAWGAVNQQGAPNLSGEWLLDRDASTGKAPVKDMRTVVITQTPDEIRFDYMDGPKLLARDAFQIEWDYQRRFVTRTQVGYARLKWDGDQLLIDNHVALNVEGTQSFDYTERWALSPDRKTLIETSSDGTKLVFQRVNPTQ